MAQAENDINSSGLVPASTESSLPLEGEKPTAVALTSEQAEAGLKALDALLLLPSMHTDTTIVGAMATLKLQLPVIDERQRALAEAEKRRRMGRRKLLKIAAGAGVTFLTVSGASSFYDAFLSPAAQQRWEAAHTLTTEQPSITSYLNWRIGLPSDPSRYADQNPAVKPRILKMNEDVIVANRMTGITLSNEVLSDGRTSVPKLLITGRYRQEVILPPNQAIVVFENVAQQETAAIKITGRATNPPTYEVRDMKELLSAQ